MLNWLTYIAEVEGGVGGGGAEGGWDLSVRKNAA
jgi:hypothetical protein